MGSIFDVQLKTLTYGGEAMGRLPDGRAVFVPYALPDEMVRVELVEEKRGFARAKLLKVLEASPLRIQPRCKHFGECGGCAYQHMDYAHQAAAKQDILREQLQRIAGVQNPPVQPVVAAPQEWNYRNTIQFHLDPQGKVGYQAANSHRVIPIQECHLPEPALNELWPQLDLESLPGLERVELRVDSGEDLMMVLESQSFETPEFSVDIPLSAVHLSPAGSIVLAGEDYQIYEILGRPFKVSAGSFFQVNTRQAERMVEHVLSLGPLPPQTEVFDVYCGVGLFSAFIAPKVKSCVGIELAPSACDDFADNLDAFENVSLYVGAAEEILPGLEHRPDIVIVDPPRAGIDRRAMDALVKINAPYFVYVSCDPATLARDTQRLLKAGYQLKQVTPFDLFPQTYHLESIALFQR